MPQPVAQVSLARIDHHPRRRYGRFAARPARVRRRVAVQDDSGVGVWWLEFQFGEGCPGGLSIEAPDNVAVFIRTERVGVNGFYALLCYPFWYIVGAFQ